MFRCEIMLRALREDDRQKKITGIKKKKYLFSLILMAALCSPSSRAEENTFCQL